MSETDQTLLSHGAVEAVERLTGQALGKTIEIGGRDYSTTRLYDPRKAEPEPAALTVHTLQGFADIVRGAEDQAYREGHGIFVHVVGPEDVRLKTGIFGEFNQRVELAVAHAVVPPLRLGKFMGQEEFVIHLLACYEPAADREAVFKVVGNLTAELVRTVEDDGVTQRATGRAGITRLAEVEIPNPVMLRPFRTFIEVEQPTSPFVLRLRGGDESGAPNCALFECDGGQWRLDAIQGVKTWLTDELTGVSVYG